MTGAELAGHLQAAGYEVREHVRGWTCECPGHEDGTPSLAIAEGEIAALVHCRAGCQTADVLAAVGLELRDLFDRQEEQAPTVKPRRPWRQPQPPTPLETTLRMLNAAHVPWRCTTAVDIWASVCPRCLGRHLILHEREPGGRVVLACGDGCEHDDIVHALETLSDLRERGVLR